VRALDVLTDFERDFGRICRVGAEPLLVVKLRIVYEGVLE